MLMGLFSYGCGASVQLTLVLLHILVVFISPCYQLIITFFLINVKIERKIMLQLCILELLQK